MTLTKAHIIDRINNNCRYPKARSIELAESVLKIIKKTLESGEEVLISGFGKFNVSDKSERRGRNPATGNELTLRARRILSFKCSSLLKKEINSNE